MQFDSLFVGTLFNEPEGDAYTKVNNNFNALSGPATLATPNAGGYVPGAHYDNAPHCTATTTLAGAANRIDMAPFVANQDLRIDRLGVACSTGVASAKAKCCVYDTGPDGWPSTPLLTSDELDLATTGAKLATVDFTFEKGKQYWLAVWHSSTATIRTIPVANAFSLGLNGADGTQYFTVLRRTITYAGGSFPNPWAFVASDLVANIAVPSFRMRVASLPANTVAPAITGTPTVGQTLSVTDGTWTGTDPITYAYQWRRGGVAIAGATANTYELVAADETTNITCTVTATNAIGSVAQVSNSVGPIAGA